MSFCNLNYRLISSTKKIYNEFSKVKQKSCPITKEFVSNQQIPNSALQVRYKPSSSPYHQPVKIAITIKSSSLRHDCVDYYSLETALVRSALFCPESCSYSDDQSQHVIAFIICMCLMWRLSACSCLTFLHCKPRQSSWMHLTFSTYTKLLVHILNIAFLQQKVIVCCSFFSETTTKKSWI